MSFTQKIKSVSLSTAKQTGDFNLAKPFLAFPLVFLGTFVPKIILDMAAR